MTTICARTWSDEVLRIVCISDTHSRERNTQLDIPNGDVLIHAGDFSRSGMLPDLRHFKSFLDQLPHPQKILVAGNHELTLHSDLYAANAKSFHESLFKKKSFNPVDYSEQCRTVIATGVWPSCCYLQDSGCKLASPLDGTASDLAVYGSPWQPEHCNMAFGLPRGAALKAKWECIPQHTDVLITHTPPYGIMDQAADGTLCGCEELLTAVKERVRPRLHVFGHIHEGHGKCDRYRCSNHVHSTSSYVLCTQRCLYVSIRCCIPCKTSHQVVGTLRFCYTGVSYDGTTLFVNAAICDASYSPTNPAIVVDLPLDRSLPAVVVDDA